MKLSRRDILKLGLAAAAGAWISPRIFSALSQDSRRPNMIILLFDAMTARNMSLYGYARKTTPHLARFAERSTVYHAHTSAGNFTTPGTASMLTGMFPWKHRAINQGGLIKAELARFNPFTLVGDEYYRYAFSQNPWPDRLVNQFYRDMDEIPSPSTFSLRAGELFMDKFDGDRALAPLAVDGFLFAMGADTIGSAALGHIYKENVSAEFLTLERKYRPDYPVGLPVVEGYIIPYRHEDIFAGVAKELTALEAKGRPHLSYFHFYSPHSPYRPQKQYTRLFRDEYVPPTKPNHPLLVLPQPADVLLRRRLGYDIQMANVDAEFGRLIRKMEVDGILEDSYVIVTSDHGEMFERGFWGHGETLMYEPNIHIPLLIHTPGQTSRADVHTPTSNVDLLPTLLSWADKAIPPELDGQILPGFNDDYDLEKPIFSMYSVEAPAFAPLKKIALSMRKGDFKLIAILGYTPEAIFELYNLRDDPEELQELSRKDTLTFDRLREELLLHLADANRPYERS